MKLTDKQKKFVKFYNAEPNATKAAISAGYSKKTAYSAGQRLLKNVEVKKQLKIKADKLADKLDITADKVIREWAILAFSNIADVLEASGSSVNIKNISKLKPEVQRSIQSISEGKFGVSIKLHDKKAGLEALSKYLHLWVDRTENTVITYDISKLPAEYLQRIIDGENYINVIAEYEHSIKSS